LEFLVLDELHTYRGRQGADVAKLTRRVRERTGAHDLQCVGTSATMATEGSRSERLALVADVPSKLFGTGVLADDVIDETLSPLFLDRTFENQELKHAVLLAAEQNVPTSVEEFLANPLAAWVERTFGAEIQDDRVTRVVPKTI